MFPAHGYSRDRANETSTLAISSSKAQSPRRKRNRPEFCSRGGRRRPLNIYKSGVNKRKRIRRQAAERKELKVGGNKGDEEKGREKKKEKKKRERQNMKNGINVARASDSAISETTGKKGVRLSVRNERRKSGVRKRMKAGRGISGCIASKISPAFNFSRGCEQPPSVRPLLRSLPRFTRCGIVDFGEHHPSAISLTRSFARSLTRPPPQGVS